MQRLDRKKALPDQDSIASRSGSAGEGGWTVVRVEGNNVRHLKVDERTVAVILRHFLYDGECGNTKGGGAGAATHSKLLASEGYRQVGEPRGRQKNGYPAAEDGGGSSGPPYSWMCLPGKKCCKGFHHRWAASLAEVVSRDMVTATATYSSGGPSSPPAPAPSTTLEGPRQGVALHRTFRLAPAEEGRRTRAADIQRAIGGLTASDSSGGDRSLDDSVRSLAGGVSEVRRTFVLGDDVGFMESDLSQLAAAAAAPLSLGPIMMLTSQCIAVLRHYLDLLAEKA
mmetsp:Transcript_9148/g.26225  ORF Transcript_9148/g.26225 Transcript_9148/m.26225 type:complete len:283 (-) Transcript_9148:328-1176(-)